MRVAVRFDDITPDMHYEKFSRLRKLCDAYGVKPLLAIVPENRDPLLHAEEARESFWEEMRALQQEGYSLAMHGVNHCYTTKSGGLFPLNRFSEFAGLPLAKQEAMLAEGKRILSEHGIETDIFVAPGHTYDKNTLTALRNTGFSHVSDGFGNEPYLRAGLTFHPIAVQREDVFSAKPGVTTLVAHTNVMEEADFARFEKVFRECDMLPYAEYLSLPGKVRGFAGNLREFLTADLKRRYVSIRSRHGRNET